MRDVFSAMCGLLGLVFGFALAFYIVFFTPHSFWIPFLTLPLEARFVIAILILCIPLTCGWLSHKLAGG